MKNKAWRPAAAFAAAGLLLLGHPAPQAVAAQSTAECPSAGIRPAGIARALAGDAFESTTGEEIRLAGILAPGSDGGEESEETREAARAALNLRIGGRPLTLAFTDAETDRYGRLVAQVFAGDEWLQGALVRAGLARAAPDVATNPCAGALLSAEDTARRSRAGHWRTGRFSILQIPEIMEEAWERAGSFAIVEGIVEDAAVVRGRAFLNFGSDYRTDFTITVAPADMRNFRAEDFDPRTLAAKRIRVRGWLELYNGPEIPIATPAAIEILE